MAGKAEYKNKWQNENCYRINLIVKKGKKAIIQSYADAHSQSLNGYINEAIDEKIDREEQP